MAEGEPGAGKVDFVVVLPNASPRVCTVTGFPAMAFVDGAGSHVSVAPERAGSSNGTVRLNPGAIASTTLSYTNLEMSGQVGVTPAALEITPPDGKAFLKVAGRAGLWRRRHRRDRPRWSSH